MRTVRELHLKGWSAWVTFRDQERPHSIPRNPDLVYCKEWRGWHDWLGRVTAPGVQEKVAHGQPSATFTKMSKAYSYLFR